jgi:hypothetical protein
MARDRRQPSSSNIPAARAAELHNLALKLANKNQLADAVAAGREAVAIRRELARHRPYEFLPDLADSLNNLAIDLAGFHQSTEALAMAQEAVALNRWITANQSGARLPNFARALMSLSKRLSAVGRLREAVDAAEEATAIRRHLAAADAETFLPVLASSLLQLADSLRAAGENDRALWAVYEHVSVCRGPAARSATAAVDLAEALSAYAEEFDRADRAADALAAALESVAVRRDLARSDDADHVAAFAQALHGLASRYDTLGQPDNALAVSEETADAYRRLARRDPDAYLHRLETALNDVWKRRRKAGQTWEQMLPVAEDLVDTYRRLAVTDPGGYLEILAKLLGSVAELRGYAGRAPDAVPLLDERVAVYRWLAADDPDAFQASLADALAGLSTHLSDLGDLEGAQAPAAEATGIQRQLAAAESDQPAAGVPASRAGTGYPYLRRVESGTAQGSPDGPGPDGPVGDAATPIVVTPVPAMPAAGGPVAVTPAAVRDGAPGTEERAAILDAARSAATAENREPDELDLLGALATRSPTKASMERLGLGVDELDALSGPLRAIGVRPLSGLDLSSRSNAAPGSTLVAPPGGGTRDVGPAEWFLMAPVPAFELLVAVASDPSPGIRALVRAFGLETGEIALEAWGAIEELSNGPRRPTRGLRWLSGLSGALWLVTAGLVVAHAVGPGTLWELLLIVLVQRGSLRWPFAVPAATAAVLLLVVSPAAAGVTLARAAVEWWGVHRLRRELAISTGVFPSAAQCHRHVLRRTTFGAGRLLVRRDLCLWWHARRLSPSAVALPPAGAAV